MNTDADCVIMNIEQTKKKVLEINVCYLFLFACVFFLYWKVENSD